MSAESGPTDQPPATPPEPAHLANDVAPSGGGPADLAPSSIDEFMAAQRRGKDGKILTLGRAVARADRPDAPARGIRRIRYTHDAMIDTIIGHPELNLGQIAEMFGYSSNSNWMSFVINSDAFQERLAERRREIIDPSILATIETKFKALADRSAEILFEKLEAAKNPTADLALATLNTVSRALGYGAKSNAVQINNKIEIVHKVS